MTDLLALLDRVAGTEVLVLGDAVLDGWLSGPSSRLSREAPVPVVDVTVASYACGGAANTAANLVALGAQVRFLSVVGDDEDGDLLRRTLQERGVGTADLLVEPGRRTAAKRRVSAGSQMLTRIDTGDSGALAPGTRTELLRRLLAVAPRAAALVVSDYACGTLGEDVVEAVGALAHPCLVVDARQPQRWAAARPRAVKPNWAEVVTLLGPGLDRAERVVAAAAAVRAALGAEVAAVTLDRDGCVLLSDDEPVRLHTAPAPDAQAAGAGDSFTAVLALGLAVRAAPAVAAELAQRAAQVVVRRPGTTLCGLGELRDALADAGPRLPDLARLADCVAAHRAAGRSIAFTNGCFDVLHAGHVGFLRQARALADVLVVGLNSDASVTRLKGPDRPVNAASDRAEVLGAVTSVDHLLVFDADTPAELLEIVRPDVYVKGGDYTPEMLPETPLVERLGGQVRILGYVRQQPVADPR